MLDQLVNRHLRSIAHTIKHTLRRKKAAAGTSAGGGFAYQPVVTEKATTGRMLRDLVDRVFHGSAGAVLLKLLEEHRLDAGEIARLREIVEQKAKSLRNGEERP